MHILTYMKTTETLKNKKRSILLGMLGTATGLVNGFFGSGGGMIAVESLESSGTESKKAHATSILAILPLSVVSSVVYYLRGSFSFRTETVSLLVGASVGGLLGAMLLGKLSAKWIDLIFTLLMLISGIRMVFA